MTSDSHSSGRVHRRLGQHWSELKQHLHEDRGMTAERTLTPHAFDDAAAEVSRDEARKLFEFELSGSSSLNTRGTQLAGLSAATIAVIASAASRWFGVSSATDWVLACLLVVAIASLVVAVYYALVAVLPTSRWRGALHDALGDDLATTGAAQKKSKADLERTFTKRYVEMAEHQRVRNQHKADDMLRAYAFLAIAVLAVALAAGTFIIAEAICE